ncbi:LOW QUALITY PROTEIN: ceramide-1-phosphate transfer protein [Lampris incognitus]|uniref:LOW QUALITY PROTEIN: ceramide-1-phosphate transfer protein n=1 Tax=Lampris incognitus TaxID=2546036 RepID=UPI0024B4B9D0|nr:LOW QUALITY PROTEIN: ceramide-1-phosphate transfer protein [Lampris incognitus]
MVLEKKASARVDAAQRRVLDEATRQRRLTRQLEALEKDNFQDDPLASLPPPGPTARLPAFSETEEPGKKRRKTRGDHFKQRFRKNFTTLLEEESELVAVDHRDRQEGVELSLASSLPQECPSQSFQAWRLLLYLKASLGANEDVLLEPYLQSWEELIKFMDSLGTIVSFFTQKIEEKLAVIRDLSLKHSRGSWESGPSGPSGQQIPPTLGLRFGAYHSVRSMVEMELKEGVVNFSQRSQSGCRTLLRLHRSIHWLKLLLAGLAEEPEPDGHYRTPAELCRRAYMEALAPYHPWWIRRAAELVFVSLPERETFLHLVCVRSQREAVPVLHTLIHALTLVHTHTQRILETHNLLQLP